MKYKSFEDYLYNKHKQYFISGDNTPFDWLSFEDYLYNKHKQYFISGDNTPFDWLDWRDDLGTDEIIEFANAWMKEEMEAGEKGSDK